MNPELYKDIAPPVHGTVTAMAHNTSAVLYEVPPMWARQMVTFTSITSNLFVVFGDGGLAIPATALALYAKVNGNTAAPHWASPYIVPAGASVSVPVPFWATHYAVVSDAGTGSWCAYPSSGEPFDAGGERLPPPASSIGGQSFPAPDFWLDFGGYSRLTVSSGIAAARARIGNYAFAEGTNKPAITAATATASDNIRPSAKFAAGSSHKLVATDSALCRLFGSTSAFTLFAPVRRNATGALHTIFSVGTDGSDNGRWDVTLNASDDVVFTRVATDSTSTASTYATTYGTAMHLLTLVYDGSAPTLYVDRASVSLSGTATGDVGTVTKCTLGARGYNTSTYGQFASAEIPEVIAWGKALSATELTNLHAWAKRRYGV